jgi:hypothetical protein
MSLSPASDGERGCMEITLLRAEVNNERYHYLHWHMERATGWRTTYAEPSQRARRLKPLALLRSTLPEGCRVRRFDYEEAANRVVVQVPGLPKGLLEEVRTAFEAASGLELDIRGQLAFDFL